MPGYLGEAEGAQLALVRLLAAVDAQVFGQRGGVAESFLAHPAPGKGSVTK